MHVLLEDDLGRLTVRRLRPWHRLLARWRAVRLDRELAAGTRPEANAGLAARAMRLTSTRYRGDLAAGLQRMLAAARAAQSPASATRVPRVPLRLARISQSAPLLAELASRLVEPGPVPVQGVAMVSQLLADGTGPLYRDARREDLGYLVEQATHALAR
jgi:hypothetical protein